jgi:Ca-activated chloride channel homolog
VAGEFPLSVAVGLDRSFSMTRERLSHAVAALRGFLTGLRPTDDAMLIGIGSRTEILAPLSTDHASSAATLEALEPWGATSLYDAILEALEAVRPATGRRALILLSDGMDRYSRASEADVVQAARRTDVLIYPIAMGKTRPPIFVELASISGARSFHATDRRALQATLATIGRELRFQYLIGYTPARPPAEDASWHSIRVSVKRPGVSVRARAGYFAR